ncbi:ScbA/BarX family gamma-butyrolactone biosynthesis protein [Streptomyces sp. NPDC052023]|uniref:ScbA/BarX family gamma-butyrolactone biosynthesis protein n=1 Tax=Streptomyces sp. NPDC052023 TaxID=3365681 RepID=UPI0037D2C112
MATDTTGRSGLGTRIPEGSTGSLVRKAVRTEALITSWDGISGEAQTVTAHWPARHPFYVQSGRYSPLLVTETIRQALALLTHTQHDIPLDHRLGWERLRCDIEPGGLKAGHEPASIELLITCTGVTRRRLGSVHLSARVEALRDGVRLATADVRYTTHPPMIYDRLRGAYSDAGEAFARALPLTAPVPPLRVGRTAEKDVVLTPTGTAHTWTLRLDTRHTVLFDHPHDHVPGMVLLEAAGQAALAEAMPRASVAVCFDTTFLRYVEFDQPCLITAEPAEPDERGRTRVKVTARQAGRPAFTSTVTTEPVPLSR